MANPIYYPSDGVAVAAAIDPQLVDNAAVTSDWVSLKNFAQIMFVVNLGATDITVDAKIQSADDSSGTNNTDITGLAVTQLTDTDDNKQVILCVDESEVNSGDTHVAVVVTVGNGTTGAYVSAVGIGFNAEYQPAFDYDVASVAQIKTLS
jgi:hypothetical protein